MNLSLDDLIKQTKVGIEGREVYDRIYLPSYVDLIEKHNFVDQIDFKTNDKKNGKDENINDYWLRNDQVLPVKTGGVNAEGSVSFDGKVKPVRELRDGVYVFEKNNFQKTTSDTVEDYYNSELKKLRICTNFDIDTYLALSNKYNNYQVYEYNNEGIHCHCIKLGKEFDINSGKKSKKNIKWRILNWDDLPQSINPEGKGTAEVMNVISLNGVGYARFIDKKEDYNKNRLWEVSLIRRDLNGYGRMKNSFIDHAFKEEEILLRNIEKQESKKKTTLIIDTNSAYLKEDFIRSLRANPKVLNELMPALKLLVKESEKTK